MAPPIRQRSLIEILEDHERSIKRLKAALARTGGGILADGSVDFTGQQAFIEGTEAAPGIAGVGNLDTGLKIGANVDLVRDGEHRIEIGANINVYDADGATVRYAIVNDGDHIFDDPDGQERYRIINDGNHQWRDSGNTVRMAIGDSSGDTVIYNSAGSATAYHDSDFAAWRVNRQDADTAIDYVFLAEDAGVDRFRINSHDHATPHDIWFGDDAGTAALLFDDSQDRWEFNKNLVLNDGFDIVFAGEGWTIDGSTNDDFQITDNGTTRFRIRDDSNAYLLELLNTSGVQSFRWEETGNLHRMYPDTAANYVEFDTSNNYFKMILNSTEEFWLSNTAMRIANVYNDSTTGSADVLVESDGRIRRTTSSARYKTQIRNWRPKHSVLDLDAKTFLGGDYFKGKLVKRHKERTLGLIAEEVAEKFPFAAKYDDEGRPDGIKWDAVTVGLLHEVQQLRKRLDKAGL